MAMAAPLLVGTAGTAAAGTAAATAATAGLFGAGGAITLGGAMTAGSMLMSVFGGLQSMQAGRAESAMYKQQAAMEQTRAAQEEANRQAQLTKILSEGMAMSAGRGGMIGSGSDIAIADYSTEEARREGGIASLESRVQQSRMRTQASQSRKQGTASLISGLSGAASTLSTADQRRRELNRTN